MKLYFVRHGKTEWNLEGRFQGSGGDSPLLPETIAELKLLSQHLEKVAFDYIFSSDLPRAVKTTQAICAQQKGTPKIDYTPDLREWQLGRLEGSKISLMQSVYPKQYHAFRNNLIRFNPKMFGAETVYQATRRMITFVKKQQHLEADNILFVGHGSISTASIRSLLGYNVAELRKNGGLTNSSVTILQTEDFENFQLLTWNDTSFLKQNTPQN